MNGTDGRTETADELEAHAKRALELMVECAEKLGEITVALGNLAAILGKMDVALKGTKKP